MISIDYRSKIEKQPFDDLEAELKQFLVIFIDSLRDLEGRLDPFVGQLGPEVIKIIERQPVEAEVLISQF